MNDKKMRCLALVTLLAWAALLPGVARAQASMSTISFQGELADGGGNPLSGDYHMRFAIYDAAGAHVWPSAADHEQHDLVSVKGGLFKVLLGARGQPLRAAHFDGGDRTLQIWVCQTPGAGCTSYEPLEPRQPIPAVAYALVAQTLTPGARIAANGGDALTVTNSSTSDGSSAGAFVADGDVGRTSAIYAENASQADGAAAGYFLAAEGQEPQGEYGETYGVYAEARSSVGTGVYGRAGSFLGTGLHGDGGRYGVYGTSSRGYGVYSDGRAHVEGNLTVAGTVHSTQGGFTFPDGSTLISAPAIPTGVIVMWSGSLSNVPAGWALCNGANGTPDLRDRFVLGTTVEAEIRDMGGATSHTHTTESHQHLIKEPPEFLTTGAVADWNLPSYGAAGTGALGHRHYVTFPDMYAEGSTVTVGGENHVPPYLRLAFIMKCGPNPSNCPAP